MNLFEQLRSAAGPDVFDELAAGMARASSRRMLADLRRGETLESWCSAQSNVNTEKAVEEDPAVTDVVLRTIRKQPGDCMDETFKNLCEVLGTVYCKGLVPFSQEVPEDVMREWVATRACRSLVPREDALVSVYACYDDEEVIKHVRKVRAEVALIEAIRHRPASKLPARLPERTAERRPAKTKKKGKKGKRKSNRQRQQQQQQQQQQQEQQQEQQEQQEQKPASDEGGPAFRVDKTGAKKLILQMRAEAQSHLEKMEEWSRVARREYAEQFVDIKAVARELAAARAAASNWPSEAVLHGQEILEGADAEWLDRYVTLSCSLVTLRKPEGGFRPPRQVPAGDWLWEAFWSTFTSLEHVCGVDCLTRAADGGNWCAGGRGASTSSATPSAPSDDGRTVPQHNLSLDAVVWRCTTDHWNSVQTELADAGGKEAEAPERDAQVSSLGAHLTRCDGPFLSCHEALLVCGLESTLEDCQFAKRPEVPGPWASVLKELDHQELVFVERSRIREVCAVCHAPEAAASSGPCATCGQQLSRDAADGFNVLRVCDLDETT